MNAANSITLQEAANLLPRRCNGGKVQVDTLKRWIKKGSRGIRLHGFVIGGRWYTTKDALEDFQRACTERAIGEKSVTPRRSRSAVERELKRLGF